MTTQNTKHKLKIAWATHSASAYACKNWHYSNSMPMAPLVKVGAWEDGKFIGVVIFSRGASANLFKPYNLEQTQGCELTRIALAKHKAPVSKILSLAIKFLKRENPLLELIVSFADPCEGHHGGIYQATNWIYTGKTSPSFDYFDKNGRKWHSRQVSEKGFNVQQGATIKTVKPSECKKIRKEGKHRYLFPLSNKEKYMKLAVKYPKRVEHESNAVNNQFTESGAIPTSALHLKLNKNFEQG